MDPARTGAGSDPGRDGGKALALALRFLNRRERTVAEVRARLERAEVPEGEAEAVLSELLELGYLDDARYACVFAQDKRALDAWGGERIARVLRERGVDRELIEAALAEADATVGGGEIERAVALLHQRFPAGSADPRDRERAFGVLARRGYASETAADAVRAWVRAPPGQPSLPAWEAR